MGIFSTVFYYLVLKPSSQNDSEVFHNFKEMKFRAERVQSSLLSARIDFIWCNKISLSRISSFFRVSVNYNCIVFLPFFLKLTFLSVPTH